jgi:long-chain acyl-CoA synthetase
MFEVVTVPAAGLAAGAVRPRERLAMSDRGAHAAPGRAGPAAYPEGVDWSVPLPQGSLVEMFDEAVARFADRPFLQFLGRGWRFGEVGRMVERVAAGFQRLGVEKGVHVGLFLPNCPYYVLAYYGVLKAGGTVVNFNPLYAPPEIRHQIEDSGTRIMVTLDLAQIYPKVGAMLDATRLERVVVARLAECLPLAKGFLFTHLRKRELAEVPTGDRHVAFSSLMAESEGPSPVTISPRQDIAVLQYTGGTTGVPKGAALTHQNLRCNAEQIALWYPEARPGEERLLGVLPFFHVFAMTTVLNYAVRMGAEIVMLPRFELREVLATISRKKPTLFPVVPTILTAINNAPGLGRHDLRSLRMCISGGAALPLEVKETFERLTGCAVVEGYGLSEASPVVTCNPIGGPVRPGSIGLPLPGTTVEIVSLEDGTSEVAQGAIGEICVRGPQVMAGYWKKPEATAQVLRQGRLHTGDIGRIDPDGFVHIVDRLKEVVITGGYKVYPRMVEEAIYQHPAVVEAAVIGVEDSYRGQVGMAFVVRRAGEVLTAEGLRRFLAERLSPIEVPRHVVFRDALPKSAVGKILKKELVREAATLQRMEDA